jgi:hypothetical protein
MKKYSQISIGELLDKISILKIKVKKLCDKEKKQHVSHELNILLTEAEDIPNSIDWINKLALINSSLWDIEDEIREKEKLKQFDDKFIQLARSVYFTNDKRFDVKNEINNFYNSDVKEQKSYEEY